MPELLDTIVTAVMQAFDLDGAALLLPVDERLELVASAGVPLSGQELRQLSASAPRAGQPRDAPWSSAGRIQAVALTASGQAIGLLALRGLPAAQGGHELLRAFANHLALTLERAQLREQAVRAQLLEEVDRLRRSLVGAVSHDLRTPLATIKVSTSTLLDPGRSGDRRRRQGAGGAHRRAGRPAGPAGVQPARHDADPVGCAGAPPAADRRGRAGGGGALGAGSIGRPRAGHWRAAGRASTGGRGSRSHLPGARQPHRQRDAGTRPGTPR